jgi:dienelactone hydrolase
MFDRIVCLVLALSLSGCLTIEPKSSAQLEGALEATMKVRTPDGEGPFPTVVILHGANEPTWRKGYADWMDWLTARGYAAVFIDSAAARGVSANAMMGPGLMPIERAADVFVTLDLLRRRPFVDARRLAVIGMSHGGDSALDALVQAAPAIPVKGLTEVPALGLQGLKAVVAFYPGCREPVMGVRVTDNFDRPWSQNIPVVIFQGGNDSYVNVPLCQAVVKRQKAKGTPIQYHFCAGEPHCFDADYGTDDSCYMSSAPAAKAHALVEKMLAAAFK